jgi:hypothetical protein
MKTTLAAATLAGLVACAASADVTINFTSQTFTGFNFNQLFGNATSQYVVGTLTGVSVNAVLEASTNFTYADDLSVYVDVEPLSTAGLLQVGGFSNLGAAQRIFWGNGGDDAPGTTVIDSVSVNPIVFTGTSADAAIWLGNGYGGAGTSGTWTGSITLIGVDVIPAPGAVALLGLAGLVGRRRR